MRIKSISIKDDKDYKKFINNLKFYKSFLFRKIEFEVHSVINKEEVNDLCSALNIKSRKNRIRFIYEKACELITNQNKNVDTCGFKNNKCYVQQKNKSGKKNGCCRLCLYQSENGCTTQNLTCKMFNCSLVKCKYKMLEFDDIKLFKLFSLKNKLIIKHDYFSLKEDVLTDLYSFSICWTILRIFYRLTKNYIKMRKIGKIDKS